MPEEDFTMLLEKEDAECTGEFDRGIFGSKVEGDAYLAGG